MSMNAASSSGLLQCSICLDDLKKPISIPCGHIHCTECLASHVASSSNAFEIPCPTCRTPFTVGMLHPLSPSPLHLTPSTNPVNPNLAYVPEKYHGFITPSTRRIYLPYAPPPTAATAQLEEMKTRLARAESTIAALRRDKAQLMDCAEGAQAAARAHAEGEREAGAEAARWKKKYEGVKTKYGDAKAQLRANALDTSSASSATLADASPPRDPGRMELVNGRATLRIPKRPRLASTAPDAPNPRRARIAPPSPPPERQISRSPALAPSAFPLSPSSTAAQASRRPRVPAAAPNPFAAAAADPPPVFLCSPPRSLTAEIAQRRRRFGVHVRDEMGAESEEEMLAPLRRPTPRRTMV